MPEDFYGVPVAGPRFSQEKSAFLAYHAGREDAVKGTTRSRAGFSALANEAYVTGWNEIAYTRSSDFAHEHGLTPKPGARKYAALGTLDAPRVARDTRAAHERGRVAGYTGQPYRTGTDDPTEQQAYRNGYRLGEQQHALTLTQAARSHSVKAAPVPVRALRSVENAVTRANRAAWIRGYSAARYSRAIAGNASASERDGYVQGVRARAKRMTALRAGR
jgi:hypothetical protein